MNTETKTSTRYRLKTHTVSVVCEGSVSKRLVDDAESAAAVLHAAYAAFGASMDRENFGVLCLSARGAPVAFAIVAIGTLTSCLIHPREVFGFAIREGAAHILIAHNHPSGDPRRARGAVKVAATIEERVRAYHTPWPDEAKDLLRRAKEAREQRDGALAALLDRDACALIRMAQAKALDAIVKQRNP